MQPDFKLREILLPLLPKHWDCRCVQMCTNLGGIFFPFGDFSISLYFLVHSVPYKENMVLRCAQIIIGLDSLEDSVSLTLIFWSLTLVHVVRIRVLLVLFHLVWFLFCSFWHWSIWGDSHSPCWTITPVPCFPVLLPPPYTRVTLLWFHSPRSSDW